MNSLKLMEVIMTANKFSEKIVVWYGRLFAKNGYAVVTRNYIQSLVSIGIPVVAIDSGNGEIIRYGGEILNQILVKVENKNIYITSENFNVELVCHETPENLPNSVVSNIQIKKYGYVVAEVSPVPHKWAEIINNKLDVLITSSFYCKKIFIDSGVVIPIAIIGHPIDVKSLEGFQKSINFTFYDTIRKNTISLSREMEASGKQKIFMAVISNFNRKDPAVLLQSFFNIASDRACLIVKLPAHMSEEGYIHHITNRFGGIESFNKLCIDYNVYILNADFTDSQMQHMLSFSDYFINVERAKGWDMTAMEALALGVPTLSVDFSASQEFVNQSNSILIPSHETCLADRELYGNPFLYAGRRWANTRIQDVEISILQAINLSEGEYVKLALEGKNRCKLFSFEIIGKMFLNLFCEK